jgi:uncharacterized protein YjdB
MKFRHSKLLSLIIIFILATQTIAAGTAWADAISKLVLSKNELTLQIGDTANLTTTAIYDSGTTETVTVKTDWNSGSPDVATVYAGVITAKSVGTSVITATYLGKTEIVNVTVTKKVKSLTIDKFSLDLRLGASQQVAITAYYDDGTSEDVTKKADYTIDASSIVSVTNGLVKGQSPGSATITIKFMNQSLTLPVNVEIVRRIDAEKSQVSLLLKGTEKIKLIATYPDGSFADVADKATWTTDKDTVADVINGTITAYGVGTATLTANYGTKTTTIKVDVDNAIKLDLDKQSLFLKKDGTTQLKLTATYPDGSVEDVTNRADWSSDDDTIVHASKGLLIAVSTGNTTVSAKFGGKTINVDVDVEVPHQLFTDELLSMQTGKTKQLTLMATYADGTNVDVTDRAVWTVDNETVALVNKGKVTAYKAGEAIVTATLGGKITKTKVEVDIPNILNSSHKNVNIQIGDSNQITLTAVYKDGTTTDVTSKADWSSSSKDIADVNSGYVLGVATGTATITAKYGTRSTIIYVSVGVLKSLTVDQEKLVLKKGNSTSLKATAVYTDGTTKDVTADINWMSSNDKVVSVDAGNVKAVASGETSITAQLDGKTITVSVQVDIASDLTANVTSVIIDLNETPSIVLTATDFLGGARIVTNDAEWKTSNSAVVQVSKGVLTPITRGKSTITATYGGKSVNIPVEIGVILTLEADTTFISTKSGQQVQVKLKATLSDGRTEDVTNNAIWKVQSYKLGSVSNGLFTASRSGKTSITASFGSKTVSIPVEIDTLKYLKTDVVRVNLKEGDTAQVQALATLIDGSEDDVTKPALWSSSNIMVADVKDGIIKATGKGTAKITVAYSNLRTTIVVTVTN